jgi:hypothetical protein
MSLAAEYCLGLGEASGKEKECQMDGKMVKCSKLFTRVRHCMSPKMQEHFSSKHSKWVTGAPNPT